MSILSHRKKMAVQLYIIFVDNFLLLYDLLLVIIIVCHLTSGSKIMDVPEAKISVTSKRGYPSLVDINDHLRPWNIVITKELGRKFDKNSLDLYSLKD